MLRYKENLPNPIVHFYSLFILRTQKWWETILRVVSLVAYGFLVQRVFMRSFWALNLSKYHAKRIDFFNSCAFPDNWNPYLAFCMEFTGSLILSIVPRLINESNRLSNYPFYKTVMKSVLAVSLVLVGFNISGGMYNPVVATVIVGRCRGHSYAEHIIIYWFGATSGSLIGSIFYPQIKESISGSKVVKKDI
nr:aquaporin-11-like [Lepeophtheirus salmonis]